MPATGHASARSAPIPDTSAPQWEQLLGLPERPGMKLQARLREAVVQAILAGRLAPGTALPSSRELCTLLRLSRNTVTAAYQQLMDDGYLESRLRSGVYVAAQARPLAADLALARNDPFRGPEAPSDVAPDWPARVRRSRSTERFFSKPARWQDYPYPFVYGASDDKGFPLEGFRECCALTLSRAQLPEWTHDLESADVPQLVEQIRQRVLPARGVFARAEEILITCGSQHACALLSEALFDSSTRLGLEEPGHPHARNSLSARSPQLLGIAVDAQGLVVDGLPALDYVYVTPSHQSPTTHAMSLERRQWLLRKAELQNFAIIEDDYEAENLYQGAPMPALKSLDRTGRVVYIGSVSKSLSPALRLGYIVASSALIATLRQTRHAMLRHPSAFLQQAYAMYLSLGHHETHARRINAEMLQRLERLGQALQQHLPDFRFEQPHGGASLWVQAPADMDTAQLALLAQQFGVLIEPGASFFLNPPTPCPFFRLRISSIGLNQIEPGIAALARAVHQLQGQG
ncbi:GntR family transcriptional regulator [Rhodoferax lacus]|uniref:GntR family transcriptional regulator n=1 Tax=Rhodoferax lacus TaxID=2184758 RepID=A0A3E1RBQ7_9BURK|nr:PLP-dependent aminotransferase family protein [Rhodoferax lacus]RFO96795.1 GntR family transcriptional regulator [Rhodoferax lacus]